MIFTLASRNRNERRAADHYQDEGKSCFFHGTLLIRYSPMKMILQKRVLGSMVSRIISRTAVAR
jgi:hypothetical protein